jgi:hypothetical protein
VRSVRVSRLRRGGDPGGEGWGRASLGALIVIVVCWFGFLFVPDRLLVYLSTRVSPKVRDTLVTLWVAAFFVVAARVFIGLQGRRRA